MQEQWIQDKWLDMIPMRRICPAEDLKSVSMLIFKTN